MSVTIIVTRHAPLVDLLRERHPNLLRGEVRVLAHVADPDEIRGQHVIGVLPLHLAAVCASVTEVPLALTPADRGTMAAGDLPLTRLREIAGAPVRYVVRTEAQVRVLVDARLELDGATMAGWAALTHESVTAATCRVCGGWGYATGLGGADGYEGPCHGSRPWVGGR